MKIKINGKEAIIENNTVSLLSVLKIAKVQNPDFVAVQKNGEFVAKESLAATLVNEGDEVDFVYFMGGGSDRSA